MIHILFDQGLGYRRTSSADCLTIREQRVYRVPKVMTYYLAFDSLVWLVSCGSNHRLVEISNLACGAAGEPGRNVSENREVLHEEAAWDPGDGDALHDFLRQQDVVIVHVADTHTIHDIGDDRRVCPVHADESEGIADASNLHGDRHQVNTLSEGDSSLEVTVGLLSLMAKFADMPKSGANLTSDWEPIWDTAQAVTLQGSETDLQVMKAYRHLHRAVMTKLLVLSDEERNKAFKKMYRKVTAKASRIKSIDRNSMDSFFLRISLSQFWTHRQRLSGAYDEMELADCRQRVFGLVVAEVKAVKDQCKKHKR